MTPFAAAEFTAAWIEGDDGSVGEVPRNDT
jgi:hypothetical protein